MLTVDSDPKILWLPKVYLKLIIPVDEFFNPTAVVFGFRFNFSMKKVKNGISN
ncbi:hypothetical protein D3C77_770070 [compost metagenome]